MINDRYYSIKQSIYESVFCHFHLFTYYYMIHDTVYYVDIIPSIQVLQFLKYESKLSRQKKENVDCEFKYWQ